MLAGDRAGVEGVLHRHVSWNWSLGPHGSLFVVLLAHDILVTVRFVLSTITARGREQGDMSTSMFSLRLSHNAKIRYLRSGKVLLSVEVHSFHTKRLTCFLR